MNKSFLDDEETLNEMNEVKNLSINEILHDDANDDFDVLPDDCIRGSW